MAQVTPEIDAFHAHLDECRQCRDNPFALCVKGSKLLEQAATSGLPSFLPVRQEETCNLCGCIKGDGKFGTCDGYCDCES